MNTNQTHGVRRATELLGSQVALARALQVTPVTVYQWLNPAAGNGRQVPPKQCVRIEQLTSGAVTRKDLRPDDWIEFWPELAFSEPNQPDPSADRPQAAINSDAAKHPAPAQPAAVEAAVQQGAANA